MVTFKTPLHLKYYFLAHWYRMFGTWFGRIYFPLVALLIAWDIAWGMTKYTWALIAIVLFLLGLTPLLKFLAARFYHKSQYIEHSFGPDSVGYSIAGWKAEVSKDQVKNIVFKPNYLIVKLIKGSLYIVTEPKTLTQIKEQLINSEYKNLIIGEVRE